MRNMIALAAAAVLMATASTAQELTAEQLEVWNTVEACFDARVADDGDAFIDCFHEDYTFWWSEDVLPSGKDFVRGIVPINLPREDMVLADPRPARIVVRGDVAVVHWGVRFFVRGADGTLTLSAERSSMTLVRENERWRYFGGGGSPLGR